jgi:hypothetical protein
VGGGGGQDQRGEGDLDGHVGAYVKKEALSEWNRRGLLYWRFSMKKPPVLLGVGKILQYK